MRTRAVKLSPRVRASASRLPTWPNPPSFVVDIMLNANGQTYDTLRRYSETLDLDGITVRTVSLEGLLLTKQTMRDKDASDRVVIERALAVLRQQTSGTD